MCRVQLSGYYFLMVLCFLINSFSWSKWNRATRCRVQTRIFHINIKLVSVVIFQLKKMSFEISQKNNQFICEIMRIVFSFRTRTVQTNWMNSTVDRIIISLI